jgi:Zn-dependent peptidase ImmA (M78 family)
MADTAQPIRLAEILVEQLRPQLFSLLPLPVEAVALACGILEIRTLETDGFEGGLVQDDVKKHGYILTRAGRHESRTRFTIAHELGHFLNLRHVAPPGQAQLLCTKEHLQARGTLNDKRLGMEAQANEFAANVLMPKAVLGSQPFMQGSPELGRILKLQALCNVSKEAAARRYAELHGADFAVVFSKDGKLLSYPVKGRDFPWIDVQPGQTLFRDTLTRAFTGNEQDVSDQEETDPAWWLSDHDRHRWALWEEVLIQRDGYRMTLLVGERKSGFDERLRERWTPRFR